MKCVKYSRLETGTQIDTQGWKALFTEEPHNLPETLNHRSLWYPGALEYI